MVAGGRHREGLKEIGMSERVRLRSKISSGLDVWSETSSRCWKDSEAVGDIGWNLGVKSHSSYRFVSLPNRQMQDPGTK